MALGANLLFAIKMMTSLLPALLLLAPALATATHRPTFLMSYKDSRCFKEMFYYGSTLELYIELVEPSQLKDEWIKNPLTDGLIYNIVKNEDRSSVKWGVLGNRDDNSYLSFNYLIDSPEKEGIYYVCLEPADTVYYNAAASSEQGGSGESAPRENLPCRPGCVQSWR